MGMQERRRERERERERDREREPWELTRLKVRVELFTRIPTS